jgi:5-methyltetrahydropteroyltriglutamate--homocysteine methyltransferase
MLNMSTLLNAIPERFNSSQHDTMVDLYFAMARGTPDQSAMEMTKWFNTNYHYIVPEFNRQTHFQITSEQLLDEIKEAQTLGISPKVVLIGPLTYLFMGKKTEVGFNRLELLPRLLPAYRNILFRIAALGVQ